MYTYLLQFSEDGLQIKSAENVYQFQAIGISTLQTVR